MPLCGFQGEPGARRVPNWCKLGCMTMVTVTMPERLRPKMAANKANYDKLAKAIIRNLDNEVFCTRLFARAAQRLEELSDPQEIAEFHSQPRTTGDPRWDALLAGVAAHTWSLKSGGAALEWAKTVPRLDQWWEPGNMPAKWRNWNLVHTPPSVRDKGVIFPRMWLEAV